MKTLIKNKFIRKVDPESSRILSFRFMEKLPVTQINYETLTADKQLLEIMPLIEADLSEPYNIYTYRTFTLFYPHLCHMARTESGLLVGVLIARVDTRRRGYIGMLSVRTEYRRMGIARELIRRVIKAFDATQEVNQIVLETEASNEAALRLYESLNFLRTKLLMHYYGSNRHAFRLKYILPLLDENEEWDESGPENYS